MAERRISEKVAVGTAMGSLLLGYGIGSYDTEKDCPRPEPTPVVDENVSIDRGGTHAEAQRKHWEDVIAGVRSNTTEK